MDFSQLGQQYQENRQTTQDKSAHLNEQRTIVGGLDAVQSAVLQAALHQIQAHQRLHESGVTVVNPVTSVATPDVEKVVNVLKGVEKLLNRKQPDIAAPILKGLRDLNKTLKDLPDKIDIPEGVESVQITNFADMEPLFEFMAEAVVLSMEKAGTLKPEVTVSAPEVHVAPAEVDLTPLEASLESVRQAVDNLPTPEPVNLDPLTDSLLQLSTLLQQNLDATKKVTDTLTKLKFPVPTVPTDPLIKYTPADIDDAGAIQYFGYTDTSGAWYIRQFDTSAIPKTLRFAFGQSGYAANFANRAALTYGIWGS